MSGWGYGEVPGAGTDGQAGTARLLSGKGGTFCARDASILVFLFRGSFVRDIWYEIFISIETMRYKMKI